MIRSYHALGLIATVLWAAAAAQGQIDVGRFERQMEQLRRETLMRVDSLIPPEQRTFVDFGGHVSLNFFAIDDIDQFTRILRQTAANVYGRVNIDGAHDFFVRASTRYDDWNSGDNPTADRGDEWFEPDLDRGIYRFDLARHMAVYEDKDIKGNIVFNGGRQLAHWANGVTLSRDIDGALIALLYEALRVDLLAGITVNRTSDIDSSRPGFRDHTKRGFFGGMVSYQAGPRHRPYVYGLAQQDYNNDDVLVTGGTTTRYEYDSHYIGTGSRGNLSDHLLYGVEGVYQGGRGLSSSFDNITLAPVTQTREDTHAFALDVLLEYLFGGANRSRINGEVLLATGDDDRLSTTNTFGGNQTGTDDNAFNAFGLLNTGLAFNTNVSNLMMFRAGASTYPLPNSEMFKRLQVGLDVFVFSKLDENAPIDEVTIDDMFLGMETDIFITWQITSDLFIAVRYGVFFPGDAIVANDDPRHFFFTGLTLAF